jgi:hypothetical protein
VVCAFARRPAPHAGRPHARRPDQASRHRRRAHRHQGAAALEPWTHRGARTIPLCDERHGTSGLPLRWGVPPEIAVLEMSGKT